MSTPSSYDEEAASGGNTPEPAATSWYHDEGYENMRRDSLMTASANRARMGRSMIPIPNSRRRTVEARHSYESFPSPGPGLLNPTRRSSLAEKSLRNILEIYSQRSPSASGQSSTGGSKPPSLVETGSMNSSIHEPCDVCEYAPDDGSKSCSLSSTSSPPAYHTYATADCSMARQMYFPPSRYFNTSLPPPPSDRSCPPFTAPLSWRSTTVPHISPGNGSVRSTQRRLLNNNSKNNSYPYRYGTVNPHFNSFTRGQFGSIRINHPTITRTRRAVIGPVMHVQPERIYASPLDTLASTRLHIIEQEEDLREFEVEYYRRRYGRFTKFAKWVLLGLVVGMGLAGWVVLGFLEEYDDLAFPGAVSGGPLGN